MFIWIIAVVVLYISAIARKSHLLNFLATFFLFGVGSQFLSGLWMLPVPIIVGFISMVIIFVTESVGARERTIYNRGRRQAEYDKIYRKGYRGE